MKRLQPLLILFFGLFLSSNSYSQITQTFNSNGSFTVPCGVTSITVQCWGGGGGGAGDGINAGISGGGGGGGGYSMNTIAVIPGTVINYTVGNGGNGGLGNANGTAGGATTFSTVTANGGAGGIFIAGTGGAGGTGTINNGSNGSNAATFPGFSGSGGNAGGPGGIGGAGINVHGNGNPGTAPGGGGGGGFDNSGGVANGGAGGAGRIIITYTGPNAGPDQYISCTTSTTMAANSPGAGTGTWTVVSGTATITTPNSPTTGITGMVPGMAVTLRWTWSTGGCPAVFDDVIVNAGICSDEPCSATPLTVGTSCSYTPFSNLNSTASVSYGQPGCGTYSGNDMWYSAVVPANGTLTIQALDFAGGTNMLPGIAIYSGPNCNTLMHQGCSSTASTITPATSTYVGTPGETIYIRVWDIFGAEGTYSLCAFTNTNTPGNVFANSTNTVTCGGPALTFSDPGGTGNYSVNSSATYTICPSTPGQYVTVSFASFNLENGFDFLTVINGAGPGDPIIGNYTGATLPPTITSSNPDGCLTFAFRSDNLNVSSGWLASITCTGTPGVNTPFCTSTNCSGSCGTWVCGDGLYPTNNSGSVGVQEFSEQIAGCLGGAGEIATAWFYFTAQTTGSIAITFDGPNGQDYDFAIWGPNYTFEPPCPLNTGDAPIRCSFADVSNTANPVGLANGAGDFYEGPEGNGFVEDLDVIAGETYAMVLNIYQNGNPQPVIDLNVTGTGTLDCTPLPIELLSFDGVYDQGYNRLRWTSATEINNDYYTLLYSDNAIEYDVLTTHPGAGNSNTPTPYAYSHISPYAITYYKLRQTDYDGESKEFGPISISKMGSGKEFILSVYPNPASNSINVYTDYEGDVTVKIVDNLGRMLTNQSFYGQGIHSIDISLIGAGIYYLQVESDHGVERIEKIIVE